MLTPYLMSAGAGLMVGVIYDLIGVRSPAPPAVALVGLLGILLGEQVPPLIKGLWSNQSLLQSWHHQVQPHMFGALPRGRPAQAAASGSANSDVAPSRTNT